MKSVALSFLLFSTLSYGQGRNSEIERPAVPVDSEMELVTPESQDGTLQVRVIDEMDLESGGWFFGQKHRPLLVNSETYDGEVFCFAKRQTENSSGPIPKSQAGDIYKVGSVYIDGIQTVELSAGYKSPPKTVHGRIIGFDLLRTGEVLKKPFSEGVNISCFIPSPEGVSKWKDIEPAWNGFLSLEHRPIYKSKAKFEVTKTERMIELRKPLKVTSGFVTTRAYVTYGNGRRVGLSLTKQDFRIFDDGIPQTLETFQAVRAKMNFLLLVDKSGSVAPFRQFLSSAARGILNFSRSTDHFGIITFSDDKATLRLPFTADHRMIESVLKTLEEEPSESNTPFYDSVYEGVRYLDSRMPQEDFNIIIALTDTIDNAGSVSSQLLFETLRAAEVPFYIININPCDEKSSDGDKLLCQKSEILANVSGGRYFLAKNNEDLATAFDEISKIIPQVYEIGYQPRIFDEAENTYVPRPLDNREHRMRIVTTRPDLKVHSRNSYIATSAGNLKVGQPLK